MVRIILIEVVNNSNNYIKFIEYKLLLKYNKND